jgi:ABC-type glycerol-3-phosphate transport system permease component
MIKKILLILFFILLLFPMYFMLTGSIQNISGIMKMPPNLLPLHPIADNYLRILKWNIIPWTINSILGTILTVVLTIITVCSGAYYFAFYKFRFKNILWTMFLIGLMIPRISTIIPMFVIMKKIHLQGTLLATILPIVFSPFLLYLARNYFETVPNSLLESARLDGAHEWQILFHIVLPISKPIVTAIAVFSSISYLQDYIWQMLVLNKDENQTLLIGLTKSVRTAKDGILNGFPYGQAMAVGIVLMIPLVIIFLVANKYFISSLDGAIKE